MSRSIRIRHPRCGKPVGVREGKPLLTWGFVTGAETPLIAALEDGNSATGIGKVSHPDHGRFWMASVPTSGAGENSILVVKELSTAATAASDQVECLSFTEVEDINPNDPVIQCPNQTPAPTVGTTFGAGGTCTGSVAKVICQLWDSTKDNQITSATVTQYVGPGADGTPGAWGFQVTYLPEGTYTIYVETRDSDNQSIGSKFSAPFDISTDGF